MASSAVLSRSADRAISAAIAPGQAPPGPVGGEIGLQMLCGPKPADDRSQGTGGVPESKLVGPPM